LAYVRFTPQEYRALAGLCRNLDLRDDSFPIFKAFLAEALYEDWPDLAARIARFGVERIRLVFRHFQGGSSADAGSGRAPVDSGLSDAEFGVVARAARYFFLRGGRRRFFRNFLTNYLKADAPALADKLARLDERRMRALYRRAREAVRRRAY
jgi:hypothetical protein